MSGSDRVKQSLCRSNSSQRHSHTPPVEVSSLILLQWQCCRIRHVSYMPIIPYSHTVILVSDDHSYAAPPLEVGAPCVNIVLQWQHYQLWRVGCIPTCLRTYMRRLTRPLVFRLVQPCLTYYAIWQTDANILIVWHHAVTPNVAYLDWACLHTLINKTSHTNSSSLSRLPEGITSAVYVCA